jgi:opacity protein-like surface antigen
MNGINKEGLMKKSLLLAAGMFLVTAVAAHAASLLGPAEPAASAGKFSVGAGYFYYDDKWKHGGNFKIKQTQTFAEGSYGLYEGMEVFLRLGGTDATLSDGISFKDNYNPYSGIGARGVLYRLNPQFDIGGTLYVDRVWSDFRQTTTLGDTNATAITKLKAPWSASFALLGQWTPYKTFVFYGGPKLFYGASTEEGRTLVNGVAGDFSRSIRTENWVGGIVGAKFSIMGMEQLKLGLELQFTSRVSVGGMVSYAF